MTATVATEEFNLTPPAEVAEASKEQASALEAKDQARLLSLKEEG